jgi:hypothetical protein
MRQQNAEIIPDRRADTAQEDSSGTIALGPVTEFLGIGFMLALLLFS